MVPFSPLLAALPATVPFVGPETLMRRSGIAFQARLGANENVFGPSPKAIAAMAEAAPMSWAYGDPELYDLRKALAEHHHVKMENVSVGEGIDGLLGLIVRAVVEPGTAVVTSEGAYPTFNFHVRGHGGRLLTTPYVHDKESPGHLLELARREQARLIYLANPDNPMGTMWPAHIIQEMIDHVPEQSLLILDEAYSEFAPGSQPVLDMENPRVLRFRTFSKAYGMAGVRVGYTLGHARYGQAFDKIRNHFGVTRLGQAGAIAALADQQYLHHVLHLVDQGRQRLAHIARANHFNPIPSATNFVTMDCGRDGDYAKAIVEGLAAEGLFVRMPGVAPLNRCIRVSVGTYHDHVLLEEKLPLVRKHLG